MRFRARDCVLFFVLFLSLACTGAIAEEGLRIGMVQEPATLNPIVGTLTIEDDIAQLLFSGLTRRDREGNIIPDLAERVPTRANGDISSDGRTITYHLVHNARWQDGVPVTSADVKFTYEAITNPRNSIASNNYKEIERVDVPDPYTVRLILKRPWAPSLQLFNCGNQGAIVPAHLLAKYSDLNHIDFAAMPIGSGPYRLLHWTRGSDMTFEANADYFRGPPNIKDITIRFLGNDNTMMIALRAQEVDVADVNIGTYVNLGNVSGMSLINGVEGVWEHLTFNTARPPLDDRRVRLALCYGFDVHEIFAKAAHNLGMLGATAENPLSVWYDRKLRSYPYDPLRASRLLESAGWKVGPDGIRTRNGQRLTLTFISTTDNIARQQTEIILQQEWKALGVDVIIKNFPVGTLFALASNGGPLYSGNFNVAMMATVSGDTDPSTIGLNSADRLPPFGRNTAFYRNAELTRLETAAASTFDASDRKKLYDRIQEIDLAEVPYYSLRWWPILVMHSDRVVGIAPSVTGLDFWNIADWRLR